MDVRGIKKGVDAGNIQKISTFSDNCKATRKSSCGSENGKSLIFIEFQLFSICRLYSLWRTTNLTLNVLLPKTWKLKDKNLLSSPWQRSIPNQRKLSLFPNLCPTRKHRHLKCTLMYSTGIMMQEKEEEANRKRERPSEDVESSKKTRLTE